ncbi:thiamine phosphate synthase [Aquicoccus porphyridii]|uniref:Thiamine-phosphate synthase n=1 Tax=Aquicoccus porphyridii TaxID=1852029 RepID=A0A5A9ZKB7_9RHOB|nr:thiamine phosphate synthase [Aquicoccus porphyridii]KAA0917499.1 thiamine phosphate synthase [Aquicoccus porphyridii]RAI55582.1 thiamine phosphate synthase [Rhodobacteraceae bacterium AsT-22]
MRCFDLSLYLVLDPGLCAGIGMVETARAAVVGGVTMVQLRDKEADTKRLIETGRALKEALAGTNAKLIVNDDVTAAVAIGADGLHIGQDDMTVAEARARIGADAILGLSVETPELAAAVDPALVDYIGAGPVFATPTKPNHKQPVGFDGLARQIAASPVPAVAIGGLKVIHVAQAMAAGARGVAVVSAICGQPDPETAARALAAEIRIFRSRRSENGFHKG